MKRIICSIFFAVLGLLFYCILMESFNLLNVLIGFIIGLIGALVINGQMIMRFSLRKVVHHFIHIFKTVVNIFVSSFVAIVGLFKRQDYIIVKRASLKDINTVIDANSITLTPGTVVVERDNESLYVLELSGEGDD